MSLNGTIVTMTAGEYRMVLAASGATLCALSHAGRDLVVPFDPASELGIGYAGRTLAPWPNRISDSRYSFDGVDYAASCNEAGTGASLHGLASWTPWTLETGPERATFTLDLPGSPAYPFDVTLTTTYLLDAEAGLFVLVSARNDGPTDAPVGLSAHPYLTCGVPADECLLGLDASRVLLTDEAMRPAELVDVSGTDFDFRVPASLAGRRVDHAFTGLPEGGWTVVLAHPEHGGVALASDAPWVQAFTGDIPELGRRGVAVEPMTCPPDAFNSDPEGVRLRPGQTLTLRYSIRAV